MEYILKKSSGQNALIQDSTIKSFTFLWIWCSFLIRKKTSLIGQLYPSPKQFCISVTILESVEQRGSLTKT